MLLGLLYRIRSLEQANSFSQTEHEYLGIIYGKIEDYRPL